MCTCRSYVGSCQCAHTQAAHNPIQMPPSTHMRGNQSEELCKSRGPCLRARAALYGWSLVPAPPPSTKDTQLRTMTEGCTLRAEGVWGQAKSSKQREMEWSGPFPSPPKPGVSVQPNQTKLLHRLQKPGHMPVPSSLPCQTAARESALWFFFFFFKYLYIFILRILYIYNM